LVVGTLEENVLTVDTSKTACCYCQQSRLPDYAMSSLDKMLHSR
jgi:hypothetical protein